MSDDRRPRALMPASLARLIGFALLAGLGVLEWARMIDGEPALRPLSWVLGGLVAAGLVLAAGRLSERAAAFGRIGAAFAGLVLALALSGLDLGLLRPAHWGELAEGLGRGAEALGGVRLPYQGRDPWPATTLEVLGSLLCTLSALLAVWPRGPRPNDARGYPLLALSGLLVLVVSPVVSLGGAQPLVLGAAVAALTACFLWLERLPVRPGVGVAVLAGIALVAALPLGAAADREEPWFDYRSFAEAIGPADPVRYSWNHRYGPIDWPREGVELFRVKADQPFYWKAHALEHFDGQAWTSRPPRGATEDPRDDLPADFEERPGWTERFEVSLRRLKTPDVVGAGTILDVTGASRPVRPDLGGGWVAERELRRGDSYSVVAHIPRPTGGQMLASRGDADERRRGQLLMEVDIRPERVAEGPRVPTSSLYDEPRFAERAQIEFEPYASGLPPTAHYRVIGLDGAGARALERSYYARTWRLAQRLRQRSTSPYDYVLRVNAHLRNPAFRYSETPVLPELEAPLEHFLFVGRRGYCQQFSGAMALLLRMGGVPARVATGFSPGGFRRRRADWIVRDTDAHSWVEAWFDGIGWVTFDPTPAATPARSQVAAIEPGQEADEAEVVGTPTPPAGPPARRPEGLLRDAEQGTGVAPAAEGGTDWALYGGLGAGALLLLGLGLLLARARGAGEPGPAAPGDLDRAIAELSTALARCGRPPQAATTLAQLEGAFSGSPYLVNLRRARYGTAGMLPSRRDRTAFRRELAAGLGWRGRALALWALPPKLRR